MNTAGQSRTWPEARLARRIFKNCDHGNIVYYPGVYHRQERWIGVHHVPHFLPDGIHISLPQDLGAQHYGCLLSE